MQALSLTPPPSLSLFVSVSLFLSVISLSFVSIYLSVCLRLSVCLSLFCVCPSLSSLRLSFSVSLSLPPSLSSSLPLSLNLKAGGWVGRIWHFEKEGQKRLNSLWNRTNAFLGHKHAFVHTWTLHNTERACLARLRRALSWLFKSRSWNLRQ